MNTGRNPWIFGTLFKDAFWLHLPGFISLSIAVLLGSKGSLLFQAYLFITYATLDLGHVYSTAWRTYLNPVEFRRLPKFYLLAPVVIFTALFASVLSGSLWPNVLMLNLFIRYWHNIRQFYGISKWYQINNHANRRFGDICLYLLCVLPLFWAVANLRLVSVEIGISPVQAQTIRRVALILYASTVLAWVVYEVKTWLHSSELNRVLAIAGPAVFYGFGLVATDPLAFGLALTVSHAFSYVGLIQVAMKKTESPWSASKRAWKVILVPACIGFVAFYYNRWASTSPVKLINAFGVVHLAFFYCHVLYDGFLWRRSHPESVLLYA